MPKSKISIMRRFLATIGLAILSLRYRIRVDKRELRKKSKGRAMLFLPNHPAAIDPIILNTLLFSRFHPRPLVIEHFYYLKGVRFFMRLVKALPLPNFESSANQWKVRQVEKSLEKVKEGLKKGDNFLIYPSGQLKQEGNEVIGGSSFVQRILEACPEVQLVLVRTTGLWGSLFSRAITGQSPSFWHVLYRGFWALLKSGVFFLPRRKVDIFFTVDPPDFPRQGTRSEINRYLETWYNRYKDETGQIVSSEPLKLISLSLWKKEFPEIKVQEKRPKEKGSIEIPPATRLAVVKKLAQLSDRGVKEIADDHHLSRDLGFDSLDFSEMQAFIDQQFDIERFVPEQLQTVRDLLELVATGQSENHVPPVPFEWPEEKERPEVMAPRGETVQQAFLELSKRMGRSIGCADELSGVLTYRKLRIGTLALQRIIRELPGRYIGVVLPSSVAGYVVILSILLAGKIPVVLNWTMGERNLNFASQLLQIEIVITARRFLEKLDVLELGRLEDRLLLMEDVHPKITLWRKIGAWVRSCSSSKTLLQALSLDRVKGDDPAVVLFTSGTETNPKAVPLSHTNLLENQRAIFGATPILKTDILYGVLPPFHSFGFSVTGLFPLLTGLKVFYAADPTDSRSMARDIARCNITMACLAPSFYRQLFKVGSSADFETVRLFISGAEKITSDLIDFIDKLQGNHTIIEGYGITECSPVVTVNLERKTKGGVGHPIAGVELCLIDPDTGKKREGVDVEGEICIRGISVFSGYLGQCGGDPFIEIDGKRWYRSGDLGTLDASGALSISGRLKRFAKIGGEMISLMALEEEITSFAKKEARIFEEENEPRLAIGIKKVSEESKPELILVATFPITREEANTALRQAGFGRIVKIGDVKNIDVIPVTATGKVHDRRIRELCNELS